MKPYLSQLVPTSVTVDDNEEAQTEMDCSTLRESSMTRYPVLRAQVSYPGTSVPDIGRELVEVPTSVTYLIF